MHRNIVAPTRYWHDYCARILVTWSEACSNGSLPDHLLVSFVYITEYVGLWLFYFYFSSFQSKAITMFRLPPSISFCVQFFFCSFCVCFFFLRLSGEQVNSKNVCIFPLVINVLCALLAVYANDIVDQLRDDGKQQRPAFNTLMDIDEAFHSALHSPKYKSNCVQLTFTHPRRDKKKWTATLMFVDRNEKFALLHLGHPLNSSTQNRTSIDK